MRKVKLYKVKYNDLNEMDYDTCEVMQLKNFRDMLFNSKVKARKFFKEYFGNKINKHLCFYTVEGLKK